MRFAGLFCCTFFLVNLSFAETAAEEMAARLAQEAEDQRYQTLCAEMITEGLSTDLLVLVYLDSMATLLENLPDDGSKPEVGWEKVVKRIGERMSSFRAEDELAVGEPARAYASLMESDSPQTAAQAAHRLGNALEKICRSHQAKAPIAPPYPESKQSKAGTLTGLQVCLEASATMYGQTECLRELGGRVFRAETARICHEKHRSWYGIASCMDMKADSGKSSRQTISARQACGQLAFLSNMRKTCEEEMTEQSITQDGVDYCKQKRATSYARLQCLGQVSGR